MSRQERNYDNRKTNNIYRHNGRQKFRNGQNSENMLYRKPFTKDFHYYSGKYNYQPRWRYHRRTPYSTCEQEPHQRSPSPLSGTEEYTLRKIQKASDMIKQKLLMPPEADNVVESEAAPTTVEPQTPPALVQETPRESNSFNKTNQSDSERGVVGTNKKTGHYDVGEIHERIITHITNLSHGKKVNLICAKSSGYDVAIQQIQKQKRLELSKALRDMCFNQSIENSEVINAIIPDIGIKIEDLPLDVIQKLSDTLDLNFDENLWQYSEPSESAKNDSDFISIKPEYIKQEIIEVVDHEVKHEITDIQWETSEGNSSTIDFSVYDNFKEIKTEHSSDNLLPMEVDNLRLSQNARPDLENGSLRASGDGISSADANEKKVNSACNVDVSLQTEFTGLRTVSTQTSFTHKPSFEARIKKVKNLDDAVKVMLKIDKEITHLNKLRKSMFTQLKSQALKPKKTKAATKNATKVSPQSKKNKKKKKTVSEEHRSPNENQEGTQSQVAGCHEENNLSLKANLSTNCSGGRNADKIINDNLYSFPLEFGLIPEKILTMKLLDSEGTLLAGSEQGRIYSISVANGKTTYIFEASAAPITALCCWMTGTKRLHILVGSVQTEMREYIYDSKELVRVITLEDGVQCMELAWDYVFIGTVTGGLKRYSIKLNKIEFEDRISNNNVLVLKATQEGARRVLLVGTRNAPVCVRDAMSGLHLRTMNDLITPTIYSLVLDKSMVYCGTTSHDILAFSFHDGNLIYRHQAANAKGISCIKVVKNLLYASCYDGNIYVYSTKTHKGVGIIEGSGGVIITMEVIKNIVIVSTLSTKFKSILIPGSILRHNV